MRLTKIYKWLTIALVVATTVPATKVVTHAQNISAWTKESNGVVVENNYLMGYLKYRDPAGNVITRNYDNINLVVEKASYYDQEDRIGYFDKLFPHFSNNPKVTELQNITHGDNIYIRINAKGEINYINAYNEYLSRYGEVVRWDGNYIVLRTEDKREYSYKISTNTPITKAGSAYSLQKLQVGEWVRVLVSEKILGTGILQEDVLEIVVDANNRVVENIYRGTFLGIDKYKNQIDFKNSYLLSKLGWEKDVSVLSLSLSSNGFDAYYGGSSVNKEYLSRYLKNVDGYAYFVTETIMGKPRVVKVNIQTKSQQVLPTSMVIYSAPGVIKLKTGETLAISEDAIVVRNGRLISANNIQQGDYIQAVISGESKIVVANIVDKTSNDKLEIFRGRIKQIKDKSSFEVETFSILEDGTWYFYPEPRIFDISEETKFYNKDGFIEDGIDNFLGYGENSSIGDTFTVVAYGNQALMVSDVQYVTESAIGNIYKIEDNKIQIKDVYYLDKVTGKWLELSVKNTGSTIELLPNTVILKNGQIISIDKLEKGDSVRVMLKENIKTSNGIGIANILVVE